MRQEVERGGGDLVERDVYRGQWHRQAADDGNVVVADEGHVLRIKRPSRRSVDIAPTAVLSFTAVGPRPKEIVELRSAGMTGYGKTFYWANEARQPVTSYPIRRTRELDRGELTARLVPADDPAAALALAGTLAPGVPAVAEEGFLILGHAGQSPGDLGAIARPLADYRDFLVASYEGVASIYEVSGATTGGGRCSRRPGRCARTPRP